MSGMDAPLDVLVIENQRHAADQTVAALEAAGHHVHRCYEPGSPGFPCRALEASGTCPLDHGIDLALVVRDRIEPRPTRYETGVSCAIRAGVPVIERGPAVLDPFEPWLVGRIEDDDLAAGLRTAARRASARLCRRILDRVCTVIHDPDAAAAIGCQLERDGTDLVVRVTGPALGTRTEQAVAVRVLDAIWSGERTFGQVDVTFDRHGVDDQRLVDGRDQGPGGR